MADLIWYAETGELPVAGSHPVKTCRQCKKRLEEYLFIRSSLRKLGKLAKTPLNEVSFDDEVPAPITAFERKDSLNTRFPDSVHVAPEILEAIAIAREAKACFMKDWAKARQLATEAVDRCERLPDPESRADRVLSNVARAESFSALGVCDAFNDRPEEGELNLTRALHLWEELCDPLGIGVTRHNLAIACMNRKALADAEFHVRQALTELIGICDDHEAARARHTLALILGDQGRAVEAKAQYLEALVEYKRLGKESEWAMAAVSLAQTERALDALYQAARLTDLAEPILKEYGYTLEAARCAWLNGLLLIEKNGEVDAGVEKMTAARVVLQQHGLWIEPAIICCDVAKALLRANRRKEAHKQLREIGGIVAADKASSWVAEAVAALETEFSHSSENALLVAWENFSDHLKRIKFKAPLVDNSQVH